MRIYPEDRSQGYTIRRRTSGGEDRYLVGWRNDRPVWVTSPPKDLFLVHREVVEYLKRFYRIYTTQPFWYEGEYLSEEVALREIWGDDYWQHVMGE